ncbi:proline-rich protein 36-like [Drosophila subpulchrella]|uniref:proline-rich protein 36-like n=1 Tax=Drosophila subpulchrella TaxID=1486046 RepID=UPI0018A1A80C|nr:proline-rich protein 36-like [Drosophila subpulchrella]
MTQNWEQPRPGPPRYPLLTHQPSSGTLFVARQGEFDFRSQVIRKHRRPRALHCAEAPAPNSPRDENDDDHDRDHDSERIGGTTNDQDDHHSRAAAEKTKVSWGHLLMSALVQPKNPLIKSPFQDTPEEESLIMPRPTSNRKRSYQHDRRSANARRSTETHIRKPPTTLTAAGHDEAPKAVIGQSPPPLVAIAAGIVSWPPPTTAATHTHSEAPSSAAPYLPTSPKPQASPPAPATTPFPGLTPLCPALQTHPRPEQSIPGLATKATSWSSESPIIIDRAQVVTDTASSGCATISADKSSRVPSTPTCSRPTGVAHHNESAERARGHSAYEHMVQQLLKSPEGPTTSVAAQRLSSSSTSSPPPGGAIMARPERSLRPLSCLC